MGITVLTHRSCYLPAEFFLIAHELFLHLEISVLKVTFEASVSSTRTVQSAIFLPKQTHVSQRNTSLSTFLSLYVNSSHVSTAKPPMTD